jgi:hypothetical protein
MVADFLSLEPSRPSIFYLLTLPWITLLYINSLLQRVHDWSYHLHLACDVMCPCLLPCMYPVSGLSFSFN